MEKMEPGEMVRRLTGFIRSEGRFDSVTIENLRKMPGGASREIWSFECAMERGGETSRRAMVLRRDPGAHNISTNRRHEFMVIRAAFEERIPVPEVFWVSEDPAVLGSAFFIMERIDGETLARRLLRDDTYARAREVMPAQLAEILAKIHRIDPVKHKLDFLEEPGDNAALTEVRRYQENFRVLALEPHPAFELAFRWLLKRVPKMARKTLVHGDYRIGNVVFGPEGVRSILDWELAHLGDPMEVGGLGSREDFFHAYEKASGAAVDPEAARFWEVFGNLRWGIITIGQARTHIDGFLKSVELASIGRRTAETELELLNLIE